MKSFKIFSFWFAILVAFTGCKTTPNYSGDGQIENTSFWADGINYTRQYTIRLASFNMTTNVQREFNLGELSHFCESKITVCIRFKDRNEWYHLAKADARDLRLAAESHWHDLDSLRGRLGYRLLSQSGVLVAQSEMPLKHYTWGSGNFDPHAGREIEIRDSSHALTRIPTASELKLSISYTGDTTLTNVADFVVLWQWK